MGSYDVIIIGAGTAGLSAAKVLKKYGAKYAIIEQSEGGTLCAKTGCMPSKSLIEAANAYHAREKFDNFGIEGGENVTANIPRILQHVRNLRDGFVKGVLEGMKDEPIIRGHARFTDTVPSVEVNGEQYDADAVIICTGSHPHIPQPFKHIQSEILTTDNFFEQKDLPKSLAVVGLGSTGVELGQALARLGVEIYGLEPSGKLAGIEDPVINEAAKSILAQDFAIDLEIEIEQAARTQSGFVLKAKDKIIEAAGILVAAGRIPNLKNLGLENTGMKLDENSIPAYDKITMQVEGHTVYIAGDANADRALQHEAAAEGRIAALHAIGMGNEAARNVPLAITFTDPPTAFVGKEYEADEAQNLSSGKASYRNQSRAKMMEENRGRVRLYADPDNHRLTGATLMAPAADHMAHLLALAIQKNMTAQELLDMPFYHPVLEEGLRGALGELAEDLKEAA